MKSLKTQSLTACYQGQHRKGVLGNRSVSFGLGEKGQDGNKTPRTAEERGHAQASEGSEHHDLLQGRLGPDVVTWRRCNQTRLTVQSREEGALEITSLVFCLL